MSHFAHKKFLVEVAEVKEGEVTLVDYEGKTFPVTEQRFKDYYIGVDLATGKDKTVVKKPSPFELEFAKQLVEFGGLQQEEPEDYIRGQQELLKNKPL